VDKEIEKAKSVSDRVAELMELNRLEALETYKRVLHLPNDLGQFAGDHLAHHRRLTLQLNAAASFMSNQIKVDENTLKFDC